MSLVRGRERKGEVCGGGEVLDLLRRVNSSMRLRLLPAVGLVRVRSCLLKGSSSWVTTDLGMNLVTQRHLLDWCYRCNHTIDSFHHLSVRVVS